MEVREGLIDLEAAWDAELTPGPSLTSPELGVDDEIDGDLLLDDSDDAEVGGPLEQLDEPEDSDESGVTWAELLGSRPARVLVRLVLVGDQVRARSSLTAPTRKAAETLAELRPFLAYLFLAGRERFDDNEWRQLIGLVPATVSRRLVLLARLAVGGNAEVAFRYFEKTLSGMLSPQVESWVGDNGEEQEPRDYKFSPNDRGLERYANKFAALPDGTPFSLRLLLLDARGRPDPHPFKRLPLALKLQALCRILEEEEKLGQAFDYETYREKFQQALESLGTFIDKPTWGHVKNFFEGLARQDLGAFFPDRDQRQRRYDAAKHGGADVA